jgi:hypothetical protein
MQANVNIVHGVTNIPCFAMLRPPASTSFTSPAKPRTEKENKLNRVSQINDAF